ncbi:MAG: hydroxymethylbilane synthase [bacterium]
MKKQKIIIGSRSSELALWQANFVKNEIEKKNKSVSVEIILIKTKGDKILDVALSKIGDKGLFTKELELLLLENKIDIAVHSLKDLQTDIPDGLIVSAVTKRHAVEDALIARKKGMTIFNLCEGAVIATGSLRRTSQLKHLRPDIKIVDLRGNVPTRVQKFLDSDWDGIILARAGIERLKLQKYISSIISTKYILPAVGQGALGIETRADNYAVNEYVQSINDDDTFKAITAERTFLKVLKGGCQVPIGAYGIVNSNGLYLDGIVGSVDGTITFRKKIRGSSKTPAKVGASLAKDLLNAGAKQVLDEIYSASRKK